MRKVYVFDTLWVSEWRFYMLMLHWLHNDIKLAFLVSLVHWLFCSINVVCLWPASLESLNLESVLSVLVSIEDKCFLCGGYCNDPKNEIGLSRASHEFDELITC